MFLWNFILIQKILQQDQTIIKNNKAIKLDIRFITSSTKNMQEEIAQGKFRQDLYFRLNVVPLYVTNLSERKEDIPLLVKYFIKQLSRFSGLKEREFSDEAIAALQAYHWPGNVRQLRNVIEWTLIMNPPGTGVVEKIKSDMCGSFSNMPLKTTESKKITGQPCAFGLTTAAAPPSSGCRSPWSPWPNQISSTMCC